MNILNWLTGKRSDGNTPPDMVWTTRAAKFSGIARLVKDRFQAEDAPLAVILVAHFPDTLAELQKIAEAENPGGPVTAVLARELNCVSTSAATFGETATIDILIAERHPLALHDEKILEFAEGLPCGCRVAHHLALDDGLMKAFVSESVTSMLKKLGMKEDEPIQNGMVSRSIQQARQKIADRVINDEPTDTAEEWLAKNLREE